LNRLVALRDSESQLCWKAVKACGSKIVIALTFKKKGTGQNLIGFDVTYITRLY
jgi:hypothetical protein